MITKEKLVELQQLLTRDQVTARDNDLRRQGALELLQHLLSLEAANGNTEGSGHVEGASETAP